MNKCKGGDPYKKPVLLKVKSIDVPENLICKSDDRPPFAFRSHQPKHDASGDRE